MKHFLTALLLSQFFYMSAQSQIPVEPSMVLNVSTWGDASKLVDEQSMAGDPKASAGGTPSTQWLPGWTSWYYPVSAVIDLKDTYRLTDIYLYDVNGSGNVQFFAGTPFSWDSLFTDEQSGYQVWQGHQVNIDTRYVMVRLSENVSPTEIVLYGSKIAENNDPEPEVVEHPKPLMKDFIGLNGFIDDPLEILTVGGFLREYHNWSFTEVTPNEMEFNRWNGFWDFDQYYKDLQEAGVTVAPALQGSVDWLADDPAHKPVADDEDAEDPLSYSEHASFMYQYAARYGSQAVPTGNLLLADGQEEKTGLGYLTYFENWNEQDRWWDGREGWFSPFEYAAMSSADMDGHLGSLGDGFGIKTADESAQFVMSGLAILGLDYTKAMKFWAMFNRNGDFPADVLNYHHYSNDAGGQEGSPSVGICPEADSLKERVAEIVHYRNKHLHGKEVWITEFGYDTHNSSVQRAPAYDDYSAEEVQAMWLIRSYLAIAAGGADRAAMYMSRDSDPESSGKYATSGITEGKNADWAKKTSYYYIATMTSVLGNTRLAEEVPSGNASVEIYKFSDIDAEKEVYVLWCPTQDGTIVNDFNLPLGQDKTHAAVVTLSDEDIDGDTIAVQSGSTSVEVNVSEKPVFVIASYDPVNAVEKAVAEQSFDLYPTIADHEINLDLPTASDVKVWNDQGVLKKEFQLKAGKHRLSVQSWEAGMYFIKIGENSFRKLIIAR